MKILTLAGVCLLTIFTAASHASVTGISIISQTNHVWGVATGVLSDETYDLTSAVPITGSASALWDKGTNFQTSSAGNFLVYAQDKSSWTFTGSRSGAESAYVFTPLTDQLQIRFTGSVSMHSFENQVSFSLVDIADSAVVDSYAWTTESSILIERTVNYSVTAGRQYSLLLHATVNPGDTPDVYSKLIVDVIPEPAAVLLLGLGGIILRQKRNIAK